MIKHISEINRSLFYTRKSCEETMNAGSGEELRKAWEDFVDNYGKTIDRLIKAGLSEPSTKAWAHRLLRASSKDDEGLQYMREARNTSQHGLEPFGKFVDPHVSIGPGIALFGGPMQYFTFSNITKHGKQIVDKRVTFDLSHGKISNLRGELPDDMQERPADVKLGTITNQEKKKTVQFPATIRGHKVAQGSPRSLASAAMTALEEIVKDFTIEAG